MLGLWLMLLSKVTIKLSNSGIPKISPHFCSVIATWMSAGDGSVLLDGWLWAIIIESAPAKIAFLKTSLGCTKEVFSVPTDTRSIPMIFFFESNRIVINLSFSSWNSEKYLNSNSSNESGELCVFFRWFF